MNVALLSEPQVRLLLFQFFDDQVQNPGADVVLTARVLRVIEESSGPGVLAAILEEGGTDRRLEVFADYRIVAADIACVRLLDYVDMVTTKKEPNQ